MIRKNLISIIVVLMVLSLTGIVLVQYFWVRQAIAVKEAQFDQSVLAALNDAVVGLERDRNVLFVSRQVWVDDKQADAAGSVVWEVSESEGDLDADVDVEDNFVYVQGDVSGVTTVSVGNDHASTVITVDALSDSTIRQRAVLRLDSIRANLDREEAIILTELQDSLNILFDEKIHQIRKKKVSVNNVIDDMVYEIQTIDDPLDHQVSADRLEQALKESMQDKGIHLGFEYGVYLPESDSVSNLRSQNFNPTNENTYQTRLFPKSVFNKPDLLMVEFPGRNLHLLKSMSVLLSGSVVFTLVILITFFITVRIIIRQKRLSEIKSDFINNMTHEFKTPIATISLAVDSINNPGVISKPERIRYFTGVIDEENKRMNARVENVLQMSMIDKNDFNLHLEELPVHELLEQITRNFELQVRNRKGSIDFFPDNCNPLVLADRIHFQNIVSNLIDNGIKYSEHAPKIRISTVCSEQRIRIRVQDEGIGMSREEQNKIFDKFYRIPQGDIHNVKGFGLGLSYVKAIVLALDGTIEVKSQPNKGTTFSISLPQINKKNAS